MPERGESGEVAVHHRHVGRVGLAGAVAALELPAKLGDAMLALLGQYVQAAREDFG